VDRKIIVAAIAVIATIAIIIIVINPFKPQEPAPDENAMLEDENVGPGPLDVLTPEELAQHDTQLQQSDPVRYEALQKSDVAICEQEANAADVGWCKAAVAEKLKDESICPSLDGGARNQCYNDVGRATANLELCKNITSYEWKVECMTKVATLNDSLEQCFEIPDRDNIENCIAWIAMDRGDASLCSQITDVEFRQDCEYNITDETGQ